MFVKIRERVLIYVEMKVCQDNIFTLIDCFLKVQDNVFIYLLSQRNNKSNQYFQMVFDIAQAGQYVKIILNSDQFHKIVSKIIALRKFIKKSTFHILFFSIAKPSSEII
ncbi:unnamed protein product [Paramecium sonneborni]|uniref:Uncharacterized protein n=1 Tax=Paramecium sonneborni TaxID=65129 RepID=A0A8S1R571_9CILI|nr:unnamed protein product [Paramecium sonneborni]